MPDYTLLRKLQHLLQECTDRSVLSLQIEAIQKLPGLARHVSSQRCNILRPFARFLSSGIRVLEIGSDCGSLTRYLGECGAKTCAVEEDQEKAAITALRCQDLPNVNVLRSVLNDLPAMLGKFDLITLVDGMISSDLLLKIRSLLRKDGVLLVARENSFGLRHFAGGTHARPCWTALTGQARQECQRAWSRKELADLLKKAGYSCVEQCLPLADHIFAGTILLPQGLKALQQGELPADILDTPLAQGEAPAIFNVQAAWHNLAPAGLVPDMADSLFFLASQNATLRGDLYDLSTLAIHFGSLPKGKKEFGKDVIFQQSAAGITVKRRAWFQEAQQTPAPVQQVLADEPFHKGTSLMQSIRLTMLEPRWAVDDVAEAFRPWFDFLLEHRTRDGLQLPGNFLDCGPFNIMIKDTGETVAFDLEWQSHTPVSFRYIVFRGIFMTLQKLGTVAMPADMNNLYLDDLVKNIARHFNVIFSDSELENIFDKENILDNFLYPAHKPWQTVKKNMLTVTFGGLQEIYDFVNQRN